MIGFVLGIIVGFFLCVLVLLVISVVLDPNKDVNISDKEWQEFVESTGGLYDERPRDKSIH